MSILSEDYPNLTAKYCKSCIVKACCSSACDGFVDYVLDRTTVDIRYLGIKKFIKGGVPPNRLIDLFKILNYSENTLKDAPPKIRVNSANGIVVRMKERGQL